MNWNWLKYRKIINSEGKAMAVTDAERSRRAEDKYAHLEKLAEAAEKEVLAMIPSRTAETQAELVAELAGYKFQCSQWGQFLNLSIARAPLRDGTIPHYSGAINLKETKSITLVPGRAPDFLGVVMYEHYKTSEVESVGALLHMHGTPERHMLHGAIPGETYGGYSGYSQDWNRYKIKRQTSGFPRWYKDDYIHFYGPGLTLYAPFGKGQEVYEQILKCTGRDAEVCA